MGFTLTSSVTHNNNMYAAENVRQSAQAPGATAAQVKAADVTFHRTGLASALANGISPGQFMAALRELGLQI